MQTINQYAVMVQDDTLPDYVKVSKEGPRVFLVSGMAADVESLIEMFNRAAQTMQNRDDEK